MWDLSSKEVELLEFCQKKAQVVKEKLNNLYTYGNGIDKIDQTAKEQKKLLPAKNALAKIIRAIKKRDYMILSSDQVTEVSQIIPIIPAMHQFHGVLVELREKQKILYKQQFRTPDEQLEVERNFPLISSANNRTD